MLTDSAPNKQLQQSPGLLGFQGQPMIPLAFHLACKIAVMLPLLLAFFLYGWFYSQSDVPAGVCLRDALHTHTFLINQQSGGWRIFLGTGQLIIDLWIVFFGIIAVIKLNNFRFIAAAALFFGIRFLFLSIQSIPFSPDFFWKNPGFPSLTVPYDRSRDFFYSGHTGTVALIVLELRTLKMHFLSWLALASLAFVILMLVATRTHYTIDIFTGLLFALNLHKLVLKHLIYFDKFFSLPQMLCLNVATDKQ